MLNIINNNKIFSAIHHHHLVLFSMEKYHQKMIKEMLKECFGERLPKHFFIE